MKKLFIIGAVLLGLSQLPVVASAQYVETKATAPNGVEVAVNTDDFAGRVQYVSPLIKASRKDKPLKTKVELYVARLSESGKLGPVFAAVYVTYGMDALRLYDKATFRGGEEIVFEPVEQDVRITGMFSTERGVETFNLHFTQEQIDKYQEDGVLRFQIRSVEDKTIWQLYRYRHMVKSGDAMVLEIPLSHIEAVKAVSEGQVEQ